MSWTLARIVIDAAQLRLTMIREHPPEEGASLSEYLMLVGLIIGVVLIVGAILVTKFSDKAKSLDLG